MIYLNQKFIVNSIKTINLYKCISKILIKFEVSIFNFQINELLFFYFTWLSINQINFKLIYNDNRLLPVLCSHIKG